MYFLALIFSKSFWISVNLSSFASFSLEHGASNLIQYAVKLYVEPWAKHRIDLVVNPVAYAPANWLSPEWRLYTVNVALVVAVRLEQLERSMSAVGWSQTTRSTISAAYPDQEIYSRGPE